MKISSVGKKIANERAKVKSAAYYGYRANMLDDAHKPSNYILILPIHTRV